MALTNTKTTAQVQNPESTNQTAAIASQGYLQGKGRSKPFNNPITVLDSKNLMKRYLKTEIPRSMYCTPGQPKTPARMNYK